jgi:hypothetical protein
MVPAVPGATGEYPEKQTVTKHSSNHVDKFRRCFKAETL